MRVPDVLNALPSLLAAIVTLLATTVMLPVPALISKWAFWVYMPAPASMKTALLVAVMLPATVTLLLPLVRLKLPVVEIALSLSILLSNRGLPASFSAPRFKALFVPVSVALSWAALTTPDCVTVPPASRVTLPAVPAPLLIPIMSNSVASL